MPGEEPVEESLTDRIAEQFETEEQPATEPEQSTEQQAEAEAPESGEAQAELVEVEFNGKTYQVPSELKDGLMAQSDYTRKTTENAERVRAVEHREAQQEIVDSERRFQESVKDDIDRTREIDYALKQWKSVDVTGMTSEQLWQINRQVDQLKDEKATIANGINGKWQTWQQEQNKLLGAATAKCHEAIAKSVPNWGPDLQKSLTDYGINEGYSPQELRGLSTDPRIVKSLWKAYQYDRIQSQKIAGKVTTVPTVKPGSSNPMPKSVKDGFALQKQLKNAKTSPQKAKLIEKELMNRF